MSEPEHRRIAGLFWVVANGRPDAGLTTFFHENPNGGSRWGYFLAATLWSDEATAKAVADELDGVHLTVPDAMAMMMLPTMSLGPVKRGKMGADGRLGNYQLPGPVLNVVDLLEGALWAAAKGNEG